MQDVNAGRFGDDRFGAILGKAVDAAKLAAMGIRHDRPDIRGQAGAKVEEHRVRVPELRESEGWVSYLKAGDKTAWTGVVQSDTLVFNVPFDGRWDLVQAACEDAGASAPPLIDCEGVVNPRRIEFTAEGGVLRLSVGHKLFFVPGDAKPDVAKAREAGQALREAAVDWMRRKLAFARVREREIQACNEAIRLAVVAYAEKAEAFLEYQDAFRDGIGFPDKGPSTDEVVPEPGRRVA